MAFLKLDGYSLCIEKLNQVLNDGMKIELSSESLQAVEKSCNIIKKAKSEGLPVYGLTRNVGQFKDETIDPDRNYDFELIAMHSTILGDDCETYPLKVCKGAWVILLNGFLRGGSFASTELVELMAKWINLENPTPIKVEYGTSPGMADTIPLMQMARQILQEYKYNPKDGEGLALLSSNALSMSEATLALHKYDKLFKMAEIGIALAILAENGNCSIIGIPGQKSSINWNAKNETILNIRKHLENHPILTEKKDTPHSHLTLRAASDILASAKEALDWAKKCVEEMINAHQGNPFVDIESGEIGSVANFDATRLFNVLTYLQTALGSLLSSIVRRGERKIYQFVGINREAMVERHIHWHLESLRKSHLTLASAVSFDFSRMTGARGKYFCNAQFRFQPNIICTNQTIYQFVGINRDAMVSRYIHWHLESLGKSLLTSASAVSFNFSRMAGARGK